jgi:HK97 gp10 family phage protein
MLVSFDASEVHDLASDIRRHAGETPAKARTVVAAGAYRVVAAAQALAPVDTGALKSSISADVDGLSFEVGPTQEHGLYQELGTSEMGPQPFLGPGFDQVFPGIVDAVGSMGAQLL